MIFLMMNFVSLTHNETTHNFTFTAFEQRKIADHHLQVSFLFKTKRAEPNVLPVVILGSNFII